METIAIGWKALTALPLSDKILLLGVPVYWFACLGYFALKAALVGMPRTERIDKTASRAMPRLLIEYGWWMLDNPVALLLKLRITANAISFFSLFASFASAVYFGMGRFGIGGWLLALSGACDTIDGRIARAQGTSSDKGEYLDAFIDRYADYFAAIGMLYYYRNDAIPSAIIAAAIIGSQAMGYAKAKGEAVGIDPKVGYMQRHERVVYTIMGTVLAPVAACFIEPFAPHPTYHLAILAMAMIAVFTNITAVWRAQYVLSRMQAPAPKHVTMEQVPAVAKATVSAPVGEELAVSPLARSLERSERPA